MARQDSMAAIERALQPPPPPDKTTAPLAVPAAGGSLAKPTLTADEKRAVDAARDDRRDREQQRLQAEKLEQQQEQQEQSRLEQALAQIRGNIGKVWDGTKGKLESLPTPGSLLFPLIILLVFFLLLIPVNGHTRLVWIWLVLTGNAEISGSNPNLGGIAGGSFGGPTTPQTSNGSNGTNPAAPPLQPFVLPSLGPFMTGVQEPL